jgi:hypothetical protein
MIVPTILHPVLGINTYPQLEQLQRILPVPIVQHVQQDMLMAAVPVRRILVVLLILPAVTLVNTYQQLAHLQLMLHVPLVQRVQAAHMLTVAVQVRRMLHVVNDVLTEQVILLRLPVLQLLVHVLKAR